MGLYVPAAAHRGNVMSLGEMIRLKLDLLDLEPRKKYALQTLCILKSPKVNAESMFWRFAVFAKVNVKADAFSHVSWVLFANQVFYVCGLLQKLKVQCP